MKKIVMVGPDLGGLGGISTVAKTWQSSNSFSDHKVKYISSSTDAPVNKTFFLIKGLVEFVWSIVCGCRLVYIHTSSYNSFRRKSLFILIAILFCKKILLHIHPTHFYQFLSEADGLEKKYIFFLLHRIGAFVVLTEEMKTNIQGLFPHMLVRVLRNPINVQEMSNKVGYERTENNLLYLGWYIKEKGVYELVDAIENVVRKGIRIHLHFYGTKQVEKLSNYVIAKNLTKVISVNGWIDLDRKIEALYKSTMLILPSHSEGIPNVVLEAMATKTPIIATFVGGLKEILKDGENAIIAEAGNPGDLSEKILKSLNNKELRERIAVNAYREAITKYDVRVIKDEFSQIIETVSGPFYKGTSRVK